MEDDKVVELLTRVSEQQSKLLAEQSKLLEDLRAAKTPSKKDVWDRTMAVAPIVSAAIIACIGAYFTYTYNLQQLKVQEIQTIERFLPHLAGDERSKRAAVLAISSLGNAKLAARVASVFASKGTASALTSMARSSDPNDQQAVREALFKTLDALAERARAEGRRADAEAQAKLAVNESDSTNDSEICDNLNKLAKMYKDRGDATAAEELERRSAALMKHGPTESTVVMKEEPKSPSPTLESAGKSPEGAELASAGKSKHAVELKPLKPQPELKPTKVSPEGKTQAAPLEAKTIKDEVPLDIQ